MSIKAVIGILIALGIVGGGAWYFSSKGDSQPSPEAAMQAQDEKNEASGTFAELMARTGNWQCDASAVHQEGASTGTVKMSDGRLRGDFVATLDGRTVNTSFIHADGFVYTWSDAMPQGFKMKLEAATEAAGKQGIDPSTDVDYSCAPWTPDESAFELPSAVTFLDMSAMGGAGMPMPR